MDAPFHGGFNDITGSSFRTLRQKISLSSHSGVLVLSRRHTLCRKNRPLSFRQFIASENFIGVVIDTGEQFITRVNDTDDKIFP
jgi:hypothetical protein